MIQVTRLNHTPLVLNSDLIESIETTPDTVIGLTSGQKIMVLETPEEIVDRVAKFRREILRPLLTGACRYDCLVPAAAGTGHGRQDGV